MSIEATLKFVLFNLGDYATATRDLTNQQHGIYLRLLFHMYATEQPLPHDCSAIARLLRLDRTANVERVLGDFFEHRDDGWHHPVVDAQIAKYHARAPQREAKQQAMLTRADRYRADRRTLFQAIRDRGTTMPFDTPMRVLRNVAKKLGIELPAHPPFNGTHVLSAPEITQPVDRNERESGMTSNHARSHGYPEGVTINHTRDGVASRLGSAQRDAVAQGICDYVAEQGITGGKPGDLALLQLIDQGAELRDFKAPVGEALVRGRAWAWIIYRVRYKLELRNRASQGAPTDAPSTSKNEDSDA